MSVVHGEHELLERNQSGGTFELCNHAAERRGGYHRGGRARIVHGSVLNEVVQGGASERLSNAFIGKGLG